MKSKIDDLKERLEDIRAMMPMAEMNKWSGAINEQIDDALAIEIKEMEEVLTLMKEYIILVNKWGDAVVDVLKNNCANTHATLDMVTEELDPLEEELEQKIEEMLGETNGN